MIHVLEPRVLLADMSIAATAGNDNISIKQTNTSSTSATIEVSNSGGASISVKVGTATSTIAKNTKKTFTGIGRITLVDLGKGDDKFTANSSVKIKMSVAGGDGKDSITGGNNADILSGDKATSGAFTDSIKGGGGNDTCYGYGGNDVIFGEGGNDSVRGGNGNDNIDGGSNPDKLFGENDNDSFTIVDGSVDTLDGGAGSDSSQPTQADHDIATKMENVAAAAGVDNPNGTVFTVSGTDGNDKIGASVDSNNVLNITINGVTLKYTHAERAKVLADAGFGGNEDQADRIFIRGKGGKDTITAGSGVEYVNGDSGDDTISGVMKVAIGGTGNDKITAQGNFPTQIGGDFDNFTNAKEGTGSVEGFDTIIGTKWADRIDCGGGNDYVRPMQAQKVDQFDDDEFISMIGFTSGRDTLDFGDRSDALTITFSSAGNDIDVTGSSGNVIINNQDDNTTAIKGGSGGDTIRGSNNSKGDSFEGNGGNDHLFGNGGNDTLKGGSGNDQLFGGDGNDVLDLGSGNDTAHGDAGDDSFTNKDGSKDTVDGGSGTNDKAQSDGDVLSGIEHVV